MRALVAAVALMLACAGAPSAHAATPRSISTQDASTTAALKPAAPEEAPQPSFAAAVDSAPAQPASPLHRWLAPLSALASGLGLTWLTDTDGFGGAIGIALVAIVIGTLALALLRAFSRSSEEDFVPVEPALPPAASFDPTNLEPRMETPLGAATLRVPPAPAAPKVAPVPPPAPQVAVAPPPPPPQPKVAPAPPAPKPAAAPKAASAPKPPPQPAAAVPPPPPPRPAAQPAAAPAPTAKPSRPVYPPGFDANTFVRQAKLNFVRLQAANDRRDLNLLREVTTDKMYEAIVATMPAREGEQQTDVLGLDANLLEVVPHGDGYRASVRFQGTVRDQGQQATRFDEVWHLYKSGQTGWLLAGIDQMA